MAILNSNHQTGSNSPQDAVIRGRVGGKRRVYFNEFNILMDSTTYLPLVSGLLQAYAETRPAISNNYEMAPYLFHIDNPETIIAQYESPNVAAFSVCMWNEQLNLQIAARVKRRWPECLIVFGGPQVPHRPVEYFRQNQFIDVAVRGEGEEAFAQILERRLNSNRFNDIAGVSWRDPETGDCISNVGEQPFARDLDIYPSPYLKGLYDHIMEANPHLSFQAIIETNRGCPFLCTFCYWGKGGLSRKYRYHGMERVQDELKWCAEKKIRYVFNADSNFGMHKRDLKIAKFIVELKIQHGFPEKFRTCYGKNTDERIFTIGELFHQHQIEKGITLSRQSLNELTLEHVKRDNIKLKVYTNLQRRFNDQDVPVYCEMILGLPGETYESWVEGVEKLLVTGLKNQIFIYHCQVYENTELADPRYRKQHGIQTRRIVADIIHAATQREDWVPEYEETVVATNTLNQEDWRRAAIFSWTTMLLHSMKTGFFVMGYLKDRFHINYTDFIRHLSELNMRPEIGGMIREEIARYNQQLDHILDGKGRGSYAPEYGEIYWDLEEMSFLEVSKDLERFYSEFSDIITDYLDQLNVTYDPEELMEAVTYQRLRIPGRMPTGQRCHNFRFNFPEYFEKRLSTAPISLKPNAQTMEIVEADFGGNAERYAREIILWGRKSGLVTTDVRWVPAKVKTSA